MTNGAKSSLGQLFVDLGIGGLGKTIQGLNAVSASFLLTKNAALQMAKPIIDTGKQAGNAAVQIEQMSLAFGTTVEQVQALRAWLKKNSLSEVILSDVEKIQNAFADYEKYGTLPENMIRAMGAAGLSWENYNSSFESTLQLLEDLRKTTANAPDQKRILREFGLSADDWLRAYTTLGNTSLTNLPQLANTLSQSEIDELLKVNQGFEETLMNFQQSMMKIWAEHGETFVKAMNRLANAIEHMPGWVDKGIKFTNEMTTRPDGSRTSVGYWFNPFSDEALQDALKRHKIKQGIPTGGAAPIDYITSSSVSSAAPIDINIVQNITGNNAEEIGRISGQEIENALNSTFEQYNQPGI